MALTLTDEEGTRDELTMAGCDPARPAFSGLAFDAWSMWGSSFTVYPDGGFSWGSSGDSVLRDLALFDDVLFVPRP